MSDINDIITIAELNFRIARGITKKIIDLYRNLYYGQWSGQAGYRKFQKIAGSNVAYLEVSTENEKALEKIKELLFDRFHLLYCQLPDLKAGDNRMQFMLNSEQAESIKAGLNNYNYERLRLLKEAREKYGSDTKEYLEAKAEIEEEYPEIRSITADDYVMSALDEEGNKSKEYQDLEESARKAMEEEQEKQKTMHGKKGMPKSHSSDSQKTEDKVIQFTDSRKKADYSSLIKNGEAQALKVADLKTEYVPVSGKKVPFYHLDIGNGESAVLSGNSLVNKDTAVLLNKKKYTVVNQATKKITKKTGKEIADAVKALSTVKNIAKGAKTVAKTAAMTNPVTGAVSIGKDILTAGVKLAIYQIKKTKQRIEKATKLEQ